MLIHSANAKKVSFLSFVSLFLFLLFRPNNTTKYAYLLLYYCPSRGLSHREQVCLAQLSPPPFPLAKERAQHPCLFHCFLLSIAFVCTFLSSRTVKSWKRFFFKKLKMVDVEPLLSNKQLNIKYWQFPAAGLKLNVSPYLPRSCCWTSLHLFVCSLPGRMSVRQVIWHGCPLDEDDHSYCLGANTHQH